VVEPEVVATSPYRIKSPVPVFCGISSRKLVLAAGIAPALATLSTSCLCCWTTRATMEPPFGAAPNRFLYKRNLQAAAWRRNTGLTSEGTWFILFMIKPILLVLFDKNQTLWFNSLCL